MCTSCTVRLKYGSIKLMPPGCWTYLTKLKYTLDEVAMKYINSGKVNCNKFNSCRFSKCFCISHVCNSKNSKFSDLQKSSKITQHDALATQFAIGCLHTSSCFSASFNWCICDFALSLSLGIRTNEFQSHQKAYESIKKNCGKQWNPSPSCLLFVVS